MLEEEEGNIEMARQLFQAASKADPRMVHVWQAWGMLEQRSGDFTQARKLFQSAVWSSAANTDVCRVWQVRSYVILYSAYPLNACPEGYFGGGKTSH